MEYGSLTFKSEPIGDFEGDLDLASKFFDNLVGKAILASDALKRESHSMSSAVDSRNAKLSHLYARVMTQGSHDAHLDMSEELTKRMKADHVFEAFAGHSLQDSFETPLPRNFDCLRATMNAYESSCHRFDDYSLKYVKYLVKACEMENTTVDMLIHRIQTVCA